MGLMSRGFRRGGGHPVGPLTATTGGGCSKNVKEGAPFQHISTLLCLQIYTLVGKTTRMCGAFPHRNCDFNNHALQIRLQLCSATSILVYNGGRATLLLYSGILLSGKLQNTENRFIRHLERCGNYRKTFFPGVRSGLSIMDSTAGSHLSSFCPHFNAQRARVTRASGVFRYFPSPLHHKDVKNYASTTCG